MSRLFSRWIFPAWLWALFILAVTWYPKLTVPDTGIDAQDKIAHFVVFAILGIFVLRAISKYEINRLSIAVKGTILSCTIFALLDEVGQAFIPGRSADLYDGLANVGGILISTVLFRYILIPLHKRFRLNSRGL